MMARTAYCGAEFVDRMPIVLVLDQKNQRIEVVAGARIRSLTEQLADDLRRLIVLRVILQQPQGKAPDGEIGKGIDFHQIATVSCGHCIVSDIVIRKQYATNLSKADSGEGDGKPTLSPSVRTAGFPERDGVDGVQGECVPIQK